MSTRSCYLGYACAQNTSDVTLASIACVAFGVVDRLGFGDCCAGFLAVYDGTSVHAELHVLPDLQRHDLLLAVVSLQVVLARHLAGYCGVLGAVGMVELMVRGARSAAGRAGEGTNVESALEKRPGERDVRRQDCS